MWIKLKADYAGHKTGDIVDVEDSIARAYIAAGKADEHKAAEQALIASAAAELRSTLDGALATLRTEVATELRNVAAGFKPTMRIDAGEDQADKTRSFKDFLHCTARATKQRDKDAVERLVKVYEARFVDEEGRVVARGLEGAAGNTGGVLAPVEYSNEMLKLDGEMAAVADSVRKVPMASTKKFYPTLRQTGTNPAATGESQIYAGMRTYRKSEKAARTESTPAFDFIELEATDLICYTEATRDLLSDAPGVQEDLFSLFRMAFAFKKDWEFLRGDGVGKPLGMLHTNNPALVTVTRETAGLISFVDILAMLSRLMPQAFAGAYWLANVTTIPQLGVLKDDAGNNLWLPGAANGLPPTLAGFPLRFTEKVPVLGAASDISLLNPKFYLEGERAGVEIAVSDDFRFDTDEVAFRGKLRNDGRPWLKGTYRQADGANTAVSPFVTLSA